MKSLVLSALVLTCLLSGCSGSQGSHSQVASPAHTPMATSTPGLNLSEVPAPSLAWLLGKEMSITAIMKARGMDQGHIQRAFQLCQKVARQLKIEELAPAPEPTREKGQENLGAALAYIMDTDKVVSEQLGAAQSPREVAIFKLAWKTNAAGLMYIPGDTMAMGYATQLEKEATALKLPSELWKPVVESIRAKESSEVVQGHLSKMSAQMPIKLAEAELEEPEKETSKP